MVDRQPPVVGADLFFSQELQHSLNQCRDAGLDFAILPLVHPRAERAVGSSAKRAQQFMWALTRSDTLLASQQWSSLFVGRLSKWLRFDDVDDATRRNSEAALREECSWSAHLAVHAVIAPPLPPTASCVQYAQQVCAVLLQWPTLSLWQDVAFDAWERWDQLRNLCDTPSNLKVALTLTGNDYSEGVLQRWFGEPVRAVSLCCSLFVMNAAGFPTLPPALRVVVCGFHERKVHVVLSGRSRHKDGLLPYKLYLCHLCQQQSSKIDSREEFEGPFYDYLQVPLQPLGDNLESQTYETFEKDPVKYAQYELAIRRALEGKRSACIMVVGAGRGPLVRAALNGSRSAGCVDVTVYAVEKNPNAVNTLLNAFHDQPEVRVVSQDMRDWEAPEKADLVVSELLGSWGDNELSPECLRTICPRYLKPSASSRSIPASYTSFVAPLSSHKIWSEIRNLARGPMDLDASLAKGVARFETPFVVRLFNVFHVADPEPCFAFHHAWDSSETEPLDRTTTVRFVAKESATVHGFAGYFSAELFPGVHISILPATFSTGMFSWFPLFLPLREPMRVVRGEALVCTFFRRVSAQKVWYEWCMETGSGGRSAIHNPNGRSYAVNL